MYFICVSIHVFPYGIFDLFGFFPTVFGLPGAPGAPGKPGGDRFKLEKSGLSKKKSKSISYNFDVFHFRHGFWTLQDGSVGPLDRDKKPKKKFRKSMIRTSF